jgi:cell division protein FtsW
MTLPFVSYGGSSLISLAFGIGILLALTRKRSRTESLAELEHAAGRESVRRGAAA